MGRPLNKHFYTNNGTNPYIVIDSAFIPGNTSPTTNATIVKQVGTGIYSVTDGTTTGVVSLIDGTNSPTLVAGQGYLSVKGYGNIVNQTTTTYTVNTINLANDGTGYAANDTLDFDGYGTTTVDTVGSDGEITAINMVVNSTESYSSYPKTIPTTTGGSGTGATGSMTMTTHNSTTKNQVVEYARTIFDSTVVTFQDNRYSWTVNPATQSGQASLNTAS